MKLIPPIIKRRCRHHRQQLNTTSQAAHEKKYFQAMHVLQKPSHQSKDLYMALFSRAQSQKTKIKKKKKEPRAADGKQ